MIKFKWKNKRLSIIVIIFIAIIVCSVLVCFILKNNAQESATVALVDNLPVAYGEIAMEMERNRGYVTDYFRKKYGANVNDAGFWNKSYGEENPGEFLKKLSLDNWTRVKVQQNLAVKNGIIADISYMGLLEGMKEENSRREKAIKNNEVIMGLTHYSEYEYFRFVFDDMRNNLKSKLGENEMKASEGELQKLYEEIKEKEFKRPDVVKVQKIFVPFDHISENEQKSRDKIKKALDELNSGKSFEKVAAAYNNEGKVIEEEFSENSLRVLSKVYITLIEEAYKLVSGEISGIIEDNGGFNIVRCIEKKEAGYISINEAAEKLQNIYMDKKYDELIDKLTKNAKVEIIENNYKKLKTE